MCVCVCVCVCILNICDSGYNCMSCINVFVARENVPSAWNAINCISVGRLPQKEPVVSSCSVT